MSKKVLEKTQGVILQKVLDDLNQRAVCNPIAPTNGKDLLNIGGNYIKVVADFRRQLGSTTICIQESQVSALQEDIVRIAKETDYAEALDRIVIKWIGLARQQCENCLTKNCACIDPAFELKEEEPKLVIAK